MKVDTSNFDSNLSSAQPVRVPALWETFAVLLCGGVGQPASLSLLFPSLPIGSSW